MDETPETYSTAERTEAGVYVPADLDDALRMLDGLLAEEARAWFEQTREEDLAEEHMGLGLTLRNGWGLWSRSRLAGWFHAIGIDHPDDMSGIVLTSYWRKVHDRPVDLAGQVRWYRRFWESVDLPKGATCPVDGHALNEIGSLDDGEPLALRLLAVGECPAGHVWVYDKPIGLRPPTPREQGRLGRN